ncbi:TFIID-18kDa-domain-containing protein [Penicillium malachiteum]|nr:TFIID-18kDa-domain-containing protein [Penicillium malachiteum]
MLPLFGQFDCEGIRSDPRHLPRALALLLNRQGHVSEARPVLATVHSKDSQLDVLCDGQSTSPTRTWIPNPKYQRSPQEAYLLSSTRIRLPNPECHPRQVSGNGPNHHPPRLRLRFPNPNYHPSGPGNQSSSSQTNAPNGVNDSGSGDGGSGSGGSGNGDSGHDSDDENSDSESSDSEDSDDEDSVDEDSVDEDEEDEDSDDDHSASEDPDNGGSGDENPDDDEPANSGSSTLNGSSTDGSSSPDDAENSSDERSIAGAIDPFANNQGTLGYLIDLASETGEDMKDAEDPLKTDKDLKASIINMIRQMMFVSGETAEPSIDTTTLIEDITRQQVLEILTRSTQLATRRGSRSISTDDLIFLIRHDKAKVSRLRTFLSWKDVRKNVKDSDDKGGADAADFAGADDAAGMGAGPQDVANKPKNKRAKVGLAWDVHSFFSVQIPERDDEEDEEEEEQNYATLQRLAAADERTKNMTREEYVFWSECRQASFTYRKSKRFREWAGFGIVTESKPNDDIVDILGFLTFEIVQTLTEEALKVKEREDHEKNRGGADTSGETAKKRKRETGLFDPPEEGRTPIEPRHIREAYRKLQATPQQAVAMLLHNGRVPARNTLRLI